MSRRVVGISLTPTAIGISGNDGLCGQKSLPSAGAKRTLASSSHGGSYLVELHEYLSKVFQSKRYQFASIAATEYSINARGFSEAEVRTKMVGIVWLAAAQSNVKVLEWPSKAVSEIAIGRKGASFDDYIEAATRNGVSVRGPCAAEAFWLMKLACKE